MLGYFKWMFFEWIARSSLYKVNSGYFTSGSPSFEASLSASLDTYCPFLTLNIFGSVKVAVFTSIYSGRVPNYMSIFLSSFIFWCCDSSKPFLFPKSWESPIVISFSLILIAFSNSFTLDLKTLSSKVVTSSN